MLKNNIFLNSFIYSLLSYVAYKYIKYNFLPMVALFVCENNWNFPTLYVLIPCEYNRHKYTKYRTKVSGQVGHFFPSRDLKKKNLLTEERIFLMEFYVEIVTCKFVQLCVESNARIYWSPDTHIEILLNQTGIRLYLSFSN